MMALSDLIIRQAKAAEKDYNLPDADGLGLVVTATGGNAAFRSLRRNSACCCRLRISWRVLAR
jgi:hypothetical protein